MVDKMKTYWREIGIALAGAVIGVLWGLAQAGPPQERTVLIKAHKYAFDPPRLEVNRGDRITIRLEAEDVTHGFFLEGYGIEAKIRPDMSTFWLRKPAEGWEKEYDKVEEITFTADQAGKFRYRCSQTCGTMHPFMQGELIVRPNYLYTGSLGLAVSLPVAMIAGFRRKREEGDDSAEGADGEG